MPATIPTQEDLDALKLALDEHLALVEAKLLEYDGLPEREKHDFADLEVRVKKLEEDDNPQRLSDVEQDLERRVQHLEGKLEELAALVHTLLPEDIDPDEPYPVDPDNPVDPDGPPDVDPPKRSHRKKKD